MTDKIAVLATCGSPEEARRIARHLVEKRVAACVNIVDGATSVYHWQGAIEESTESLLVIKSSRPLFDRLRAEIRRVHSYQVPEIVALGIIDGSPDYLDWMNRELADGG
jgi:periplasmic divalent cation tolerance protein